VLTIKTQFGEFLVFNMASYITHSLLIAKITWSLMVLRNQKPSLKF